MTKYQNHIKERCFAGGILGILILYVLTFWGAFQLGYGRGYKTQYKEQVINSLIEPSIKKPQKQDLDLDIDRVINGIIQLDGENPTPEFEQVINEVYLAIVNNVADYYGFSDSKRKKLLKEYESFSQELVKSNFDELKQLSQARETLPNSSIVNLKRYDAADDFHAVLSDQACFIMNTLATFAHLDFGDIFINSTTTNFTLKKSCTYIVRLPVYYLVNEMKKRGIVQDFIQSEHKIKSHTRRIISELAITEDTIAEIADDQIQKKVWFITSKASLVIKAESLVKAGFELHKVFDVEINPSKEIIYVTLPKATILSNSMEYEILEDESQLFAKVTKEHRNKLLAELKLETTQTAIDKGILDKAEKNVDKIINEIYFPITSLSGSNFKVKVRFR